MSYKVTSLLKCDDKHNMSCPNESRIRAVPIKATRWQQETAVEGLDGPYYRSDGGFSLIPIHNYF